MLTGASVVVMYALLCVAVLVGRLTGRTAHAPYRMPLFPLAPSVGLMALLYVLFVYLTQFYAWSGSLSLLEQHAFLVPAPLFGL